MDWEQRRTERLYREGEKHENFSNSCYEIEVCSVLGTAERQEDREACILHDTGAVMMICDGMGGMERGDLAAEHAVRLICGLAEDYPWEEKPSDFIREAIQIADEGVYLLKNGQGKRLGGGCTLALAVFVRSRVYWGNVGDSRIYFYRRGALKQISEDHNYGEWMKRQLQEGNMDAAEYRRGLPRAAALTSYLGIGGVKRASVSREGLQLQRDDIVLLQSDGLYRLVGDDEMCAVVRRYARDAERASEALLTLAEQNRAGYQDNTSIILARLK